jgi:hypothetical protein
MAEELASGEEVGAAIAVDIGAELVVDIWGGHADAAGRRRRTSPAWPRSCSSTAGWSS